MSDKNEKMSDFYLFSNGGDVHRARASNSAHALCGVAVTRDRLVAMVPERSVLRHLFRGTECPACFGGMVA